MTDHRPLRKSLDLKLLQYGDRLRRKIGGIKPRRIVTLHHLACSGGTIMTKCLATMPQAMVLSEIHPESVAQPAFDPLAQLRSGYRGELREVHQDLLLGQFRREIVVAHTIAQSLGKVLVLRDHAHADFAWRRTRQSALVEALSDEFEITPILTMRNPQEAWISMQREDWFSGSVDEFCQAQIALIEAFEDAPLFHYEDFVEAPDKIVRAMCETAGIAFAEGFEQRLDQIDHLTGDSGRKGSKIEPRPAKSLADEDRAAFDTSEAFRKLNALVEQRR